MAARKAVQWGTAIVGGFVLLLAVSFDLSRAPDSTPKDSPGPILVVSHRLDCTRRSEDLAVSLAFDSLAGSRRKALLEAFEGLCDDLHSQVDPMIVNLDDTHPGEALRPLAPALLPTLTAARALAPSMWCTDEGAVSIAIACPAGAIACIPIGAARERLDGKLRISSWAISYSILLEATRDTPSLGEALREEVGDQGSHIALVVTGSGRTSDPDVEKLRAFAKCSARVACSARHDACEVLRVISAEPSPERLGLDLNQRHVLVLPKLGSLAHFHAFQEQVLRVATTSGDTQTRCVWGCSH